jgi:hypothetical protein
MTVWDGSSCSVYVPVQNNTKHAITLYRGTSLGTLQPVQSVIAFPVEKQSPSSGGCASVRKSGQGPVGEQLGSDVKVSEREFSENQPNNTCKIERAEECCQNADGEQWDPGVDLSEKWIHI